MRFNKKTFVIVDAYTTGRFLAPLINANGYSCIHIQSCKNVIPAYAPTFVSDNFINNIIYIDNIKPILEYLKSFEVVGVIPGAETGVILADMIGNLIGLYSVNNPKLSYARRDKYQMVNCLEKHQILHARSFKSNDLNMIINFVKDYEKFPIVIKPLSSSGSHGVKVCHDMPDLINGFKEIMDSENVFNELNTNVMIQQFLDGQEYIVNTVSFKGKHKVIDIWRKYKNHVDGLPINDYSEIVEPLEKVYTELSSYIYTVLDALEIRFGAGHSEIIVTKDGPILIETAARLAGSIDPSAVNEVIHNNQVSSLVYSYINSENFIQSQSVQKISKYARHVFLTSSRDGKITNQPNLLPIINLKSFHSISFRFEKGHTLVKTTSLADFPGFVYLVSKDKKQVESDYTTIREYEKALYNDMCSV